MIPDFYEKLDHLYATDPRSVEAFLLDALEECRDKEDDAGLVAVANELGGLYRGQGRYTESIDQFEFAMEMLEDMGMGGGMGYLTALLNRAGTYRLNGQAREAVAGFHKVLGLLADQSGDVSYVRASALNNLALSYQELDDLEAAEEYARKALSIMEKQVGMEAEVASSRNNLSAICLRMGRLEDADLWLERAMEYYEGPAGAGDPHQSAAFSSLAAIRYRQGRLQEALDAYEKAASVTLRFFGKTLDYAAICYGSAIVSHDLGMGQCVCFLKEAVSLFEQLQGKTSPMAVQGRRLLRQWKGEMDH